MSAEEAEKIIPGMYCFKWDTAEENSLYQWNVGSYPEGWCEQFSQIYIAEIDDGKELPYWMGLMSDENGTIRAITFCYPTAG